MKRPNPTIVLVLSLALGSAGAADTPATPGSQKGAGVAHHAHGTFDVQIKPLPADDKVPGLSVGRLAFDKRFKGDFEGTSKGEMMTAETSIKGSAGYVAIEQVTGKLRGRDGSFLLLHQGTMKGGDFDLAITVVPDSGTGELAGLVGKLTIVIAGGTHSYDFDYTLPDVP